MQEAKHRAVNIMITGGGTGGHLFPAIAVADMVLERIEGSKILFAGTGRHVDSQALLKRNFKTAVIHCQGVKGKSLGSKIKAMLQLPGALLQSMALIRKFKPVLVFGVGGYVTGPVLLAAKLMRVLTCVHEQNSIPGVTNRLLGRFVDKVFVSMPGSEAYFPVGKALLTGNPVRKELLKHHGELNKQERGLTLLVIGGSQGAHRVNTLVIGALDKIFNKLPDNFEVIHQTGVADEQQIKETYGRLGIQATVSAFIQDMGKAYEKADLVISRAGATTLAELTLLNKAAILIPFPYAADNHQEKNAEYLVQNGAAVMLIEKDLTEVRLGKEIVTLLDDEYARMSMSQCAAKLAKPDATEKILEECLAMLATKGIGDTTMKIKRLQAL